MHHKHDSNIYILPHFLSKFGQLLSHSRELCYVINVTGQRLASTSDVL